MGLSPKLTLAGIILVLVIGIVGVNRSPEQTPQILAFCGPTLAVLLHMLQTDFRTERLAKKIDVSDQKTEQKAEEVRADVRSKSYVEIVNARTLKSIEQKVDDVKRQTNGDLTKKLETIEAKVNEVKDKLPDGMDSKTGLPRPPLPPPPPTT